MHRHSYKGKKFGRQRDQREALLKSLTESLIRYESIETTLVKAKELKRYSERLITKAKIGDLHNRRQIMAAMQTKDSAQRLVDVIAPQLKGRSSGYLRLERTSLRRGDNAQLAKLSFVDELKLEAPAKPKTSQKSTKAKKLSSSGQKTTASTQLTKVRESKKLSKQSIRGATKSSIRHTRSGER